MYSEVPEDAVSIPDGPFAYEGVPVEPTVTVTLDGAALVEDEDYEVEYADNNAIGATGTVRVYGIGGYEFDVTKTFEIGDPEVVNAAKAREAESIIEALPATVASDADKEAVDAAKSAYDALTEAQKELVHDEMKDKLDAAVASANQYAADKVASLVEALPATVASDADKAKVEAAVAVYYALTDVQKALVSEALKARLDAAVASAQQYADAQANKDKLELKANPMTVKAKAVKAKAKKLKKKAMKVAPAKAFAVGGAQGAVTYKLLKVKAKKKLQKQAKKKIKVSSDGTIKLAKKLKKGTYSLTVQVSAAGNASYKPASKTVTVKVKVK